MAVVGCRRVVVRVRPGVLQRPMASFRPHWPSIAAGLGHGGRQLPWRVVRVRPGAWRRRMAWSHRGWASLARLPGAGSPAVAVAGSAVACRRDIDCCAGRLAGLGAFRQRGCLWPMRLGVVRRVECALWFGVQLAVAIGRPHAWEWPWLGATLLTFAPPPGSRWFASGGLARCAALCRGLAAHLLSFFAALHRAD